MSWRPVILTCGLAVLFGGLAPLGACGGNRSTPETAGNNIAPAAETSQGPSITHGSAPSNDSRMAAMADVGALDRAQVDAEFDHAAADIDRCLQAGRKRVRCLAGDIELDMKVNGSGRAIEAKLVQSTLGDHEVESCILKAYQARQWPRPVGGKVGEIKHTGRYSVADADPPAEWTAEVLTQKMADEAKTDAGSSAAGSAARSPFADMMTQLERCRTDVGASRLQVTMYVDQDGFVQSVGLAADQEKGRGAATCVETVLKTTSFPSPGDSPAKMTVMVR